VNKQKWIELAETIDALRIFPRLFMVCYCVLFLWVGFWAMGLTSMTMVQGTFAGAIIAAGAAWFGLYNNSGRVWRDKDEKSTN